MAQTLIVLFFILFISIVQNRIIRVTYGFPRPNTKSWFQPNFYFTAFNDETEYESSNMQLSPTRITTTAPTIKALAKRVHKGDPREFLG